MTKCKIFHCETKRGEHPFFKWVFCIKLNHFKWRIYKSSKGKYYSVSHDPTIRSKCIQQIRCHRLIQFVLVFFVYGWIVFCACICDIGNVVAATPMQIQIPKFNWILFHIFRKCLKSQILRMNHFLFLVSKSIDANFLLLWNLNDCLV